MIRAIHPRGRLLVVLALSTGLVALSAELVGAQLLPSDGRSTGSAPGARVIASAALPGRVLRVGAAAVVPTAQPGIDRVSVSVTLADTGPRPLSAQPGDFTLVADGDAFSPAAAAEPAGSLSGAMLPGQSRSGTLAFELPAAAVPVARILYRSAADGVAGSVAVGAATAPATAGTTTENPLTQPAQTGSGTDTAPSGELALVRAKVWVSGSTEPGAWMVAGVSEAGVLAAGPPGAGGSWDKAPTGAEAINYSCFAFSGSAQAAPCDQGPSSNAIEDDFQRADQAGWGTATNNDGVPPVAWGMDGDGSLAYVSIAGDSGQYAYPGSTDGVGIASAGGSPYLDGDALAQLSVSAIGNATPYLVENACPDKSCYYGAQLQTSQGRLEVTEREAGITTVLASVPLPFSMSPGASYWLRLDVSLISGSFAHHAFGASDPWGTAVDQSGNLWFAAPGCDYQSSCGSTSLPGQIGELVAATGAENLYTLPDIGGNQAFFLAVDGSGNIWFATPYNGMIGELIPGSQTFAQWAVSPGSGPFDVTFNRDELWYTENFTSAVGVFDPTTDTYADVPTPSQGDTSSSGTCAGSNPYGIVGNDPANGNLVWFTENNSCVARIGVVNTASNNAVSEYPIRAAPTPGLTPHLIALDEHGHPWWTEGFVSNIGTLNPHVARSGSCGPVTNGACHGITEYAAPTSAGPSGGPCGYIYSHLSGIHIDASGMVWTDDSLSAQLFSFDPKGRQFTAYALLGCGPHPHDGLNVDASGTVWWDEEFAGDIGSLSGPPDSTREPRG